MKNKLEVIAWSLEDAIRIEQAGADRIELVVNLERGGLTPPMDLIKAVVNAVAIPVRVMIRNTDQSFIYDAKINRQHIKLVKEVAKTKAEGIVYGSLNKKGRINFVELNKIIKAKGNLKLAFHRAFDTLENKVVALDEFSKLANYDVDTLLTSGLELNALKGKRFIKQLVSQNTRINILAGSGINMDNYREVLQDTNVNYLHVGYAVRDENNEIDIKKIKEMKKGMN